MPSRKRIRTSTTRNPRAGKRLHTDPNSDAPTQQTPAGNDENLDDASQLPSIRADMTRDELYEAARRYEADHANSQRTQREAHRTALADVTNMGDNPTEDKAAEDDLNFVRAAGKKFLATSMLWLPAGREDEIWAAEEDDHFDLLDRFDDNDQPANKIQGALRDIYAVLPEPYRNPEDFNGWIPAAFTSGMNNQRSFTVTRLRHHPDLFDCTTAELSSQERRRDFRELIGYQSKRKKPDEFYYDTINVPVLHADYEGKFDTNKIFLGPLLFIVHAAITLGPAAAGAIKANLAPPKVQSVAHLWGLKRTTPGMIAAAAIWLRWLYSVDDTFVPTGNASAIEWQQDFEYYLQFLTEGLLKKKPSIINIFRVWDNKFYPHSNEGFAHGVDSDDEGEESRHMAMEQMNAEDEPFNNDSDSE